MFLFVSLVICARLKYICNYRASQETDEIRTDSLPAGRFQMFSVGRTNGEAAPATHSEEREALRVWVLNKYVYIEKVMLQEEKIPR